MLFAALTGSAWAEWQAIGNVSNVVRTPNGVELTAGKAKVLVTVVNDATVRVRVAPSGTFDKDFSWAVDPAFKPAAPAVRVQDGADAVVLEFSSGRIRVTKSPLRIAFLDAAGNVVNEDDDREPMAFDGGEFRVTKKMPSDLSELYFGLGDKTSLVLNNRAFTMWNTDQFGWQESNDPLYKDIPFFFGMKNGRAYGIFMDNTWRSSFDFGKARHDAYSFGAEGGPLNYYFFYGPDPKRVLGSFSDLTGKTPLPPLWTLGYQQSRYSYMTEARLREVARTFREKKIPADVLYLDIDYQDKNRPFTIDRNAFPHFEEMVKDLRKDGFSLVTITDLHIAQADYPPYKSGTAEDVFMKHADGSLYVGPVWPGASVFPDFTLSKSREWWGKQYADFVAMGVRGFWNDMDEPSVFKTPTKTMPLDVVSRLDDGSTLPHLGAHNVIGMENSRATFEGLLKLEKNERPFVLTRATYAGGHRYSATWTGDNSATYNHLRMSLPTLLNLNIGGFAMSGDDIGGFNGTAPPDLVTRWMWLGVFNPIYRNHSAKGTGDKEPWVFGPQYETYMKAAIEERYRLLPYIYSVAEESSRTGMPIMRPLFLEFPQETWLNANEEEYMFGPSMLVAPKVWEMMDPYDVHLPTGDWYDYWSGEKFAGGETASKGETATAGGKGLRVNPKINEIPVYVKAGSVIAEQPVVQSTAFTPQGNLALRVYPGPNCSGHLYMDDGHTFNYTHGESLSIAMTCSGDATMMSLALDKAVGTYKPWFSFVDVVFAGVTNPARSALLDGKGIPAPRYDAAHHTATVTVPYTGQAEKVSLQF
ncbi:MAG TPA: glycoside hydrolase family 31 protein [Acidobacteriaceae bacterium]|nr:glycoside hydrolase family 31 protein [Acidobacteriaceae bacterium]